MYDAQNIETNAAEIVNCLDDLAPSICKIPEIIEEENCKKNLQYTYNATLRQFL
jgi:hypothetical protein